MQCCPGSTWSHAGSLENCFKLRTREMRGRFGSVWQVTRWPQCEDPPGGWLLSEIMIPLEWHFVGNLLKLSTRCSSAVIRCDSFFLSRSTSKARMLAADKTDRLLGLSAAHLAAEQGHVAVLKVQTRFMKSTWERTWSNVKVRWSAPCPALETKGGSGVDTVCLK